MSDSSRYVVARTSTYVTLVFGGGVVGMQINGGHRYLATDAAVKQRPDLFGPVPKPTPVGDR